MRIYAAEDNTQVTVQYSRSCHAQSISETLQRFLTLCLLFSSAKMFKKSL